MKEIIIGMLSLLSAFFQDQDFKQKRVLTPIENDDMISVIKESYYNVHKKEPKIGAVAGAWAQIALENKRGKRIWNHNFGNVGKLPEDPATHYYSHFGKAKYRSFSSFVQGAEAYWVFISRCGEAVRHFENKNPRGASLSLKRCNYYRSDQEQYADTLSALYAEGLRRAEGHRSSR